MSLDALAIAGLLPHRGAMCLLERMIGMDDQTLSCQATSHVSPEHPLRGDQGLGAAILIEYAAQAMALHAALQAPGKTRTELASGRHGVIAGVRRVNLYVARIDTLASPLDILVTLISGDSEGALYGFVIRADGRLLADGRLTVVFLARTGS